MPDDSLTQASHNEQNRAKMRTPSLTEEEYYTNLNEAERKGWEKGWKEGWAKGWYDGREQNIKEFILPLLYLNLSKDVVIEQLQREYDMDKRQAIQCYEQYANNPPFCTRIRNW